jgi:hypothetical protein
MSRYCLILVLVTAALLIACGGGTAARKIGPAGNGASPPGSLSASASTIDFGNVAVGSSSTRTGTLTAAASAVTISSANWSGQGYSVSGITFPITLMTGNSVPFTVTFAPQVTGTASGGISFISDASNSPTTESLTGTGTQAPQALHSVALFWRPSLSSVIGYNVYRGTTAGGPYPSKLTSSLQPGTSLVDNTVLSGTTYFYVATSVDQASAESIYSNEIQAVVP